MPIVPQAWGVENFGDVSEGWISHPLDCFSLWKIVLHVPLQVWKMVFKYATKSFTTFQNLFSCAINRTKNNPALLRHGHTSPQRGFLLVTASSPHAYLRAQIWPLLPCVV